MKGRILDLFAGLFESGNSEFSALQFMSFPLLRLEHLGDGGAAELSPSSAADIPFDEVAPFGQGCPIGITLVVGRNGKEFPTCAYFDAFEDVYPYNSARLRQ